MRRVGRRATDRLERAEKWLIGKGRLVLLLVGICLIAAALVALLFNRDRAVTLLAGIGAATWALWTTAARVRVTRETAQGALLAQLLQRYHSPDMSLAVGRLLALKRLAGEYAHAYPDRDAFERYLSEKPGKDWVCDTYHDKMFYKARLGLRADVRAVFGFYATVARLFDGGFLPRDATYRAIGLTGASFFLNTVELLATRESEPGDSMRDSGTREFFQEMHDFMGR